MHGFGKYPLPQGPYIRTALHSLLIFSLLLSARYSGADPVPAKDQAAYRLFYSQVNSKLLSDTVDTLAGFGSRVAGYPGEKKAADYVLQQMANIVGAQNVHTDDFQVTIPYDLGVDNPDKEAYAQLIGNDHHPIAGSNKLKIYPLWPNLVRTPTLPAGGLTAPLIYVGDGDLSHFNGKNVEGSVALIDFNCGQKWLNAPRLGAKAVVFIAPDSTMRGEAEAKFIGIPIAIPRFYMTQSEAAPLLAACAAGYPPTIQMHCQMPWKVEPERNFTAIIPGTDPKMAKQVIVIESYYDSISVVPALAPGADASCGMAGMLELMRIFKANPPKRTMMFVATTAHFQALQGIREYLNQHMDSWMPPGMIQSAMAQENRLRSELWLGAFLILFAVMFLNSMLKRSGEGAGRINGFMITNGIALLVMIGLNTGFYASPHPKKLPHPMKIYLWIGLDLTSQSDSFGIFYKGWFYDFRNDIQGRFSDIARVCRDNAVKVGTTMGFDSTHFFDDGVNPVNGKVWRNYIPGQPAFDSEPVTMAGGNGVTFATTNDSRALVDTPFDTADHVNIANLAVQMKLMSCLIWHIVTDPNNIGDSDAQRMPITDPSQWSRMALQGGFATLNGRVQIFNPRKSFIATSSRSLYGSLVVVRSNTKSFMGVLGNMVEKVQWAPKKDMAGVPTDDQGRPLHFASDNDALASNGRKVPCENYFTFHGVAPLTAYGWNKPVSVAAYHIDNNDEKIDSNHPGMPVPNLSRGNIDYAPDLGPEGASVFPLDVMVTTARRSTPIIVFRCVPTAIYDLVDQQSLQALTGINVYDGETNGTPRMYGYAINPQSNGGSTSYVEDVAVLFAAPGSRLKLSMTSGPGDIRLLLINSIYNPTDPFNVHGLSPYPEGIGYLVAGNSKESQDAQNGTAAAAKVQNQSDEIARSGAIYDTALHVAEDMWKLDDYRMERLAKYRILNMKSQEGTPGLHNDAYKKIQEAKQALDTKQWEKFDAVSREAWGLESRAYPDVQQTAMDVVEGVLFYLALLIPFSYFCERLFFGYFDLKRQLIASSIIFILIFICFRYIHPAFDITMNPVIVLLAFVMLALSSIVIALLIGKFEEQLKKMNQTVSGIHRADIGRVSVALAAFNLGISNMRRRKARTFLTCTTLVLLTFTVLSFTSVVQVMHFNKVSAPSDYGPRYNGIMIRTPMWDPLQEPAYRILADEYGQKYSVAPRAWFYGTSPGEQSFLTLQRADRSYDARALCGLSPEEAKITRPQDALLTDDNGKPIGRWFQPDDRYDIILPDSMAQALHISRKDVGTAKVTYSGVEYTVIGILNSQKLKRYYDLDNEMITPVDFIAMSKQSQSSSSGGGAGGSSQGFKEYIHLEPDSVFFIPYHTAINMGAQLRSIAIDFNRPKQVLQQLKPLMQRLELNLYAGQITDPTNPDPAKRGNVFRYSSMAGTSSHGMEMVFIPILIASLIVLNTMLNSVFERIKEIHIFSSIGLAPNHIGMLFIAEAMVYAILGSVAGYLLGQLTSKLLVLTGWLPGLYLNFSSISAVGTTMIVVAVVLLSTIYPARKAAEVATPAIDRTWKAPDPDGDHWTIPMPFAVTGDQATALNSFLSEWLQAYEEYSIGDFVTQGVNTEEYTHEKGLAYRITSMLWLAPFDLGVSQRIALETTPTDTPEVFEIHLLIDRVSGDISNWKRVNRRFLNTLRKQFLIWRTLKQADRERYLLREEEVSDPDLPINPQTA